MGSWGSWVKGQVWGRRDMGSELDFPADRLGDPDPQSAHRLGGRGSLKLCGPETVLTRAGTGLCLSVSLPVPCAPSSRDRPLRWWCLLSTCRAPLHRTEPPLAAPWSGAFCGVLMSPGHVAVLLNTQASGSCSSLGSPEWAGSLEGRGEAPPLCGGLLPLLGCEAGSRDLLSLVELCTQASPGPGELLAPTASPCPKSLSCSACGPIAIATPCDAAEESGSFRKVWGEGSRRPIHYLGTWQLGAWGGALEMACPARLRGNWVRGRQPGGLEACQEQGCLGWLGPGWLMPVYLEPAWAATRGTPAWLGLAWRTQA